jgi:hypothetical protein
VRRLALARSLALAALWLATARPAAAQVRARTSARNSIYAEVLGNGGLYSINYDRRLGGGGASIRVGAASFEADGGFLVSVPDERHRFLLAPVLLNLLTGAGTHHLELGGGVLVGSETVTRGIGGQSERFSLLSATGTLGYRRQPADGGFVFRIGLTPIYGFGTEEAAYPEKGFFLSGGLSLGVSF